MNPLWYIDWELMGTMGIVFSAEHLLEMSLNAHVGGFWPEFGSWAVLFAIITAYTANKAEENDEG